MTVGKALKEMFATYGKKPLLFSGIYLVVMLPLFIIQFLVGAGVIFGGLAAGNFSSMIGIGIVYIIFMIVLGFVAGVLFFGGTIRAVDKVREGKSAGFGECLSYAFGKIWAYLGLVLRVFWYSLAWLFVLLIILWPVVMSIFAASMGTANAQGLIDASDSPSMISQEGLSNLNGLSSLLSGAGLIFGLAFLVLLVIVIIRSLKAMFSFYFLFDEDKITTKDALKKSIELTKGNLWRIIGYWLVISILIGLVSWVITSIVGPGYDYTTGTYQASTTYMIVSFIFQAIVSPMVLIYYFVFYKGLRKEKGMH
jgi:hypothetical protein